MVDQLSYTVSDLVDATGIGRNTILKEIHAKRLRAFRVGEKGQKWIVPRSEAEKWICEQLIVADEA